MPRIRTKTAFYYTLAFESVSGRYNRIGLYDGKPVFRQEGGATHHKLELLLIHIHGEAMPDPKMRHLNGWVLLAGDAMESLKASVLPHSEDDGLMIVAWCGMGTVDDDPILPRDPLAREGAPPVLAQEGAHRHPHPADDPVHRGPAGHEHERLPAPRRQREEAEAARSLCTILSLVNSLENWLTCSKSEDNC